MSEDSHGDMLAKAFGGGRQRIHYVRMRILLVSSSRQGIVNPLNADCCDWTLSSLSRGGWELGE